MEMGTQRERKRGRTREAIVEAAMERFRARGYDATTADEIAADAEVSRRTFFRYFPTKDAVVFHRHAARLARFEAELQRRLPGESAYRSVGRACLAAADEFMADRDGERARHAVIGGSQVLVARELELDAEWEAAMARALEDGSVEPSVRRWAAVVAGALMGAIRATLREWFEGGCADDLRARGAEALELLERGVGGEVRAARGDDGVPAGATRGCNSV